MNFTQVCTKLHTLEIEEGTAVFPFIHCLLIENASHKLPINSGFTCVHLFSSFFCCALVLGFLGHNMLRSIATYVFGGFAAGTTALHSGNYLVPLFDIYRVLATSTSPRRFPGVAGSSGPSPEVGVTV